MKIRTIIVNLIIIAVVICFVADHTSKKREESNNHELVVFQNTAETAGQIIANYLEDEQHLCDIWASYINNYESVEGKPMTIEEAVAFTRRASISDKVDVHIIYYDDGSFSGLSRRASAKNQGDYSVSYKNYSIFSNFSEDELKNEIRQTAAFTNPKTGVLSMAFLNIITLQSNDGTGTRKALLMRIIPVSEIKRKLVYLKGEYEDVDLAIIDDKGNYLVRGSNLKNANLFEYFKSYNNTDYQSQREFEKQILGDSGFMEITDSKGRLCVVAHTPVTSNRDWFLINIIPKVSLIPEVVDWMLLVVTIGALAALLLFNMVVMMLFNRRLARANAAKSRFLSMMSHDIRTPMNAISGFNELIGRETNDKNIIKYSEAIRMAEKTLLGLINDILDFSKLEAGKLDIIPEEYDLVNTLNGITNMIRVKTEEKNLQLIVNIDSDLPRRLYGDELRLKQCILNILTNAVKYTHEGTVTFTVSYEMCEGCDEKIRKNGGRTRENGEKIRGNEGKARENDEKIRKNDRKSVDDGGVIDENYIFLKVSVADTGIGIKEEDIHKLFIAFKRLEESRNRNIEGAGLGLSITQSLLNMMGTGLQVSSEYGKGSVFSFEVKQKVIGFEKVGNYEETLSHEKEAEVEDHQNFIAPEARLLVVDDTPLNISVFISLLKDTKMIIDSADSGLEALKLSTLNSYDIIFMDHMMPEMDGIETLHRLKELKNSRNETTPVICLTANAISGMKEMFLAEGFNDYLAKPIDFKELESQLLNYLPKEKVRFITVNEINYTNAAGITESGACVRGRKSIDPEIIKMYRDAVEENVEKIRSLWEAESYKDLTIQLHSLKSTSSIVGAAEVAELAANLEMAGKEGELKDCGNDIEKLLMLYLKQGKKRLLLVDDDPLYLKMMRRGLEDTYKVNAVKSGQQALAFLKSHKVDALLLDYEMKYMNGKEVLEHLRANPDTADIPVIFLTGASDEDSVTNIMALNPAGYILKGTGVDVIIEELEKISGV